MTTVVHLQLREDVRHVRLPRFFADAERPGEVAVRQAERQVPEDVALAGCQVSSLGPGQDDAELRIVRIPGSIIRETAEDAWGWRISAGWIRSA